jgi:beta-glucosidase
MTSDISDDAGVLRELAEPHARLAENPDIAIELRVADRVSRLTLEEKVSLLSETAPDIPRLGIRRYYHGNEALHGVVRPGQATVFPQAIALAATWNPDLIRQVAAAISDEARAKDNENQGEMVGTEFDGRYSGLLTFWSPTVNMARDPRWGRTAETYGEDPHLTSRIGVAFVKGLQGDDPRYIKVVSTPKHFVANNEEHNRFECQARISERALHEYYLPGFKACIVEGQAQAIMSAYNAVNGVPCTGNPWLLTDLLRDAWGFDGYVVTDCGAISHMLDRHRYVGTPEEAAALAINAGVNLECGSCGTIEQVLQKHLIPALEQGLVSTAAVDHAVTRVLTARFRLGMFDPPERVPYTQIPPSVVGCREHVDLALCTARESIVLLKNEAIDGRALLPLSTTALRSLAIVGPNAALCQLGDYSGDPANTPISPLDGIRAAVGEQVRVMHVPWDTARTSFLLESEAAAECDVVVAFLGLGKEIEQEGRDKPNLDLPKDQQALMRTLCAANPRTVAVLINGSPISMDGIDAQIPAILEAWYPGEQGGKAIADVLFGEVNPAGRLPLTFYRSAEQLLPLDNYEVAEGRTYMYLREKPLYPFGHGLSYTSFAYRSLSIQPGHTDSAGTVSVTVEVENTGARDGDEIVQLYVRDLASSVQQPLQQLRAFRRIHLERGATQTITIPLVVRDLAFYDVASKAWVVEPGVFEIRVGPSSGDIRLVAKLEVTGSPGAGENTLSTQGED